MEARTKVIIEREDAEQMEMDRAAARTMGYTDVTEALEELRRIKSEA